MVANPGEKVWLNTYQKKRKAKANFKINFPGPIRGHLVWYMNNFEMEAPVKFGVPVAQSALMKKEGLDKCATPPEDSDYSADFKEWLEGQNGKNGGRAREDGEKGVCNKPEPQIKDRRPVERHTPPQCDVPQNN